MSMMYEKGLLECRGSKERSSLEYALDFEHVQALVETDGLSAGGYDHMKQKVPLCILQ